DDAYLNLSRKIVSGLAKFVARKSATTGEHVPVIFYTRDGDRYLLISLISLSDYQNIDDKGQFTDTGAIDAEALKVGLQVNLDELLSHHLSRETTYEPQYVRWIQRRAANLPDYIQEFVPVGKKIDDRISTKEFLSALTDYLSSTFEYEEQRSEIHSAIVDTMR